MGERNYIEDEGTTKSSPGCGRWASEVLGRTKLVWSADSEGGVIVAEVVGAVAVAGAALVVMIVVADIDGGEYVHNSGESLVSVVMTTVAVVVAAVVVEVENLS